MIAAVFCLLFALSLRKGRKPLCLRFAERISDGIMPEGAEGYCRRLTWVWTWVLFASALFSAVTLFTAPAYCWLAVFIVPLVFAIELPIRNRRFRVVFHTSGSTGKSKTIVKPFATLAKEVAMHRRYYREAFNGVAPETITFIGTVRWDHMLGKLWMEMLPKAMGAKVVAEVIMEPEALIARMQAAEKVFLVTTPSFLDRFTAYAGQYEVPRNCVEILTSGAKLTKATAERTKSVFGVCPRQIFGSTETGGVAWLREAEVAHVFEEVRIKGVTTGSVPMEGNVKKLAVKSPFSFRKGWYVMGDGAEIAADGRTFKLCGRLDRMVKINEERVNLAEMEERVRALGYDDCACVALEGEHGAFLALALVAKAGTDPENTLELRKRMAGVFPRGTVPRKFRYVTQLPRNEQGKVLKSEIEKLF